jgi:hypothetical protein
MSFGKRSKKLKSTDGFPGIVHGRKPFVKNKNIHIERKIVLAKN